MFDRHEILKAHYAKEINSWNWSAVKKNYETYDRDGDTYGTQFIGSVQGNTPSGKIYAFWTTNQTKADVTRDEAWWAALEEIAHSHGCFVESGEGSGDGIFVSWFIEQTEEVDYE